MKPTAGRGIRDACADGELFGVQGLVQAAFRQDRIKGDALQLLVLYVVRGRVRLVLRCVRHDLNSTKAKYTRVYSACPLESGSDSHFARVLLRRLGA